MEVGRDKNTACRYWIITSTTSPCSLVAAQRTEMDEVCVSFLGRLAPPKAPRRNGREALEERFGGRTGPGASCRRPSAGVWAAPSST